MLRSLGMSRRPLCTFVCVASLAGCAKPKASAEPTPTAAAAPSSPAKGDRLAPADPKTGGKDLTFSLGLRELDQILAVYSASSARYSGTEPLDATVKAKALLLQLGFPPTFFDTLDLHGFHGFRLGVPRGKGVPPVLAGTIAVRDGRGFIAGIPEAVRPRPMGQGAWEMTVLEDVRVSIREDGSHLRFGSPADQVAAAAGLQSQLGQARRIQFHIDNLALDASDRADLIASIPALERLGPRLEKVFTGLRRVELGMDASTEVGYELVARADAPFSALGLSTLGTPRKEPSPVEARLPARGVVAAVSVSLGELAAFRTTVEGLLAKVELPPVFGDPVQGLASAALEYIEGIDQDVTFALYVGPKADATLLIAAQVRDAEKAKSSLRRVFEPIAALATALRALGGSSQSGGLEVTWKADGLRVGKRKADRLTIQLAKTFEAQAKALAPFLDGMNLEVAALSEGNLSVLAIGREASTLFTEVTHEPASASKSSLRTDAGLALARSLTEGCQLCSSLDIAETERLILRFQNALGTAPEREKERSRVIAALKKHASPTRIGIGATVTADAAKVAVGVSKEALLPPPVLAKAMQEATALIGLAAQDPPTAETPAGPPPAP